MNTNGMQDRQNTLAVLDEKLATAIKAVEEAKAYAVDLYREAYDDAEMRNDAQDICDSLKIAYNKLWDTEASATRYEIKLHSTIQLNEGR